MKRKFISIKISSQTKRIYLDDVTKVHQKVIRKLPKLPRYCNLSN